MREKLFYAFGLWAIALILFIATFIIIRWTVDFATWSSLDSGWAQAIGSVAAIFAAFFLGERQASKARRDAIEIVKLELTHRRSALLEICRAAKARSDLVRDTFVTSFKPIERYELYDHALIKGVVAGLEGAPVYELGDADAINAFLEIKMQCGLLMKSIDDLDQDQNARLHITGYPNTSSASLDMRRRNIGIHCNRIDQLFLIVSNSLHRPSQSR